jgi:hypothetical protein
MRLKAPGIRDRLSAADGSTEATRRSLNRVPGLCAFDTQPQRASADIQPAAAPDEMQLRDSVARLRLRQTLPKSLFGFLCFGPLNLWPYAFC